MASEIFKDFIAKTSISTIKAKLAANPDYAKGIDQLCDPGDNKGEINQVNIFRLIYKPQKDDLKYTCEFMEAILPYHAHFDPNLLADAQRLKPIDFAVIGHNALMARLLVTAGANVNVNFYGENIKIIEKFRKMGLLKLVAALENPSDLAWQAAFEEQALLYFNEEKLTAARRGREPDVTLEEIQIALGIFEDPDQVLADLNDLAGKGRHDEVLTKATEYTKKSPTLYKDLLFRLAKAYEKNADYMHAISLYQEIDRASPHHQAANENALSIIKTALSEAESGSTPLTPEEKRQYLEFQFRFTIEVGQEQSTIDGLCHTLGGGKGMSPTVTNVGVNSIQTYIDLANQTRALRDEIASLKDQNARLMAGKSAESRTSFFKKSDQPEHEETPASAAKTPSSKS